MAKTDTAPRVRKEVASPFWVRLRAIALLFHFGEFPLKRSLFGMSVLAAAVVFSNCNCGGAAPIGAFCNTGADCESKTCGVDNRCIAAGDGGTGGGTGGQAGGMGGNGGNGGNGGGAPMTLPDGGPCAGLQCQVATCTGGTSTTLTGKVYDPGGNVPLYNAIVYVPNAALKQFPTGATCDACGALVSGNPVAITLTDASGSFRLENVPDGANIPLVVQIGKWRRQVNLTQVNECQENAITDVNLTRLPRNQSEGDLPLMALASGDADAFECLLRKIGISDSEFTNPSGSGRVHFYRENGGRLPGTTPNGDTLWASTNNLTKYDVVILPCEGRDNYKQANQVSNMVNYANIGGRVFATHYSYVWTEIGWPAAATWDPGLDDLYAQTFNVTVDQSFPKGMAFAQWLHNVNASMTVGTLGIRESRHDVTAVGAGSTRWLYGDIPAAAPKQSSIQHLTYNTPFRDAGTLVDGGAAPQCGRVVFSDFHVTAGAVKPDAGTNFPNYCVPGALSGQEKALEFMLFDLSACVQDDATGPSVCKAVGQGCASDGQCCAGLSCLDNMSNACTGAGCTCEPGIN